MLWMWQHRSGSGSRNILHRGDGSGADDFAQNSLIYRCALQTLKFRGGEDALLQAGRDPRYYNTGSCVHPISITGLEMLYNDKLRFDLIAWQCAIEGNILAIKRAAI